MLILKEYFEKLNYGTPSSDLLSQISWPHFSWSPERVAIAIAYKEHDYESDVADISNGT